MKQAIAHLKSISPYSQSRFHGTDKLPKENSEDYEARCWRGRLHVTDDGFVYMPPMAFKNCLSEGAKFMGRQIPGKGKSTYTKHFEAGVLVMDPLVLAVKAEDVAGEWLFVPADGVRGSGKRVKKCFPVIPEWQGAVTFHVLDDTITEDVFEEHLREAGSFIGVGRFRPRNNGFLRPIRRGEGRLEIEGFAWQHPIWRGKAGRGNAAHDKARNSLRGVQKNTEAGRGWAQ